MNSQCPQCSCTLRHPNRRGTVSCPKCSYSFQYEPQDIRGLPSLTASLVKNGIDATALRIVDQTEKKNESQENHSLDDITNTSRKMLVASLLAFSSIAIFVAISAFQQFDWRSSETILEVKEQEFRQSWDVQQVPISEMVFLDRDRVSNANRQISLSLEDNKVLFDYNSAVLSYQGRKKLEDFAKSATSRFIVFVLGHTDSRGGEDYNLKLSKRRAETTSDYLSSILPSGASVHSFGFGETQPVASNNTAIGRASNRRVELIVEIKKRRFAILDFLSNLPDWVNGFATLLGIWAALSLTYVQIISALKRRVKKYSALK